MQALPRGLANIRVKACALQKTPLAYCDYDFDMYSNVLRRGSGQVFFQIERKPPLLQYELYHLMEVFI